MAKLSKAQERTLERAKERIDKTRSMTLEEYIASSSIRVSESFPIEWFEETYKENIDGIVVVNSTMPTLKKLEELGFIEIVEADEYRKCNCGVLDKIKVLNY